MRHGTTMQPANAFRFIPETFRSELLELWHISKGALSGEKDEMGRYKSESSYHRKLYVVKWFNKKHPEYTSTAIYKDLDGLLS